MHMHAYILICACAHVCVCAPTYVSDSLCLCCSQIVYNQQVPREWELID